MFADRLKELQDDSNIKNKQFSDIIGVSVSTLSKYKSGKREPSFQILCKIAEYFGVTADYLLERTDVKTFNDIISLESFKNSLKEYPPSVNKTIDKIYSIVTNKNNFDKLDSLQLILNELDNLLKL